MTDNLRDRIAAAIYNASNDSKPVCYTLADAVIAELGLRTEWGLLDHTDSGLICDSIEDAETREPLKGERLRTRLVTDWVDVPEG